MRPAVRPWIICYLSVLQLRKQHVMFCTRDTAICFRFDDVSFRDLISVGMSHEFVFLRSMNALDMLSSDAFIAQERSFVRRD